MLDLRDAESIAAWFRVHPERHGPHLAHTARMPELARSAAIDAIAAMSLEGDADRTDAAAPPADA